MNIRLSEVTKLLLTHSIVLCYIYVRLSEATLWVFKQSRVVHIALCHFWDQTIRSYNLLVITIVDFFSIFIHRFCHLRDTAVKSCMCFIHVKEYFAVRLTCKVILIVWCFYSFSGSCSFAADFLIPLNKVLTSAALPLFQSLAKVLPSFERNIPLKCSLCWSVNYKINFDMANKSLCSSQCCDNCIMQCCGSGSAIQLIFDSCGSGIRDGKIIREPGWTSQIIFPRA
jgi:hypothetical protein